MAQSSSEVPLPRFNIGVGGFAGAMKGFRCLLLLQLLRPAMASPPSVNIALVSDMSLCIGIEGRRVELRKCLIRGGAAWAGTYESLQNQGKLELMALEAAGAEVREARRLQSAADRPECARVNAQGRLQLWPCDKVNTTFHWDPDTLQLKTEGRCLGAHDGELVFLDCQTLGGGGDDATRSSAQNGEGAPAEQSWVLLPTARPQIDMLESVALPLRASGRYVGDSKGRRVKLAGVNWVWLLDPTRSAFARGRQPAEVAQMVKYLGFNSVRIVYNDKTNIGELDQAVAAATNEKLLVVLAREGSEQELLHAESKKEWLEALTFMAGRYKHDERVVAMDIHAGPGVEGWAKTLAWWGVPDVLSSLAQTFLGLTIVDWRTAAAEGAVAVWSADPNMLVVVQGGMYGTDLRNAAALPLNLAQDCLKTRLAFATRERRWFSSLFELLANMRSFWNPYEALEELQSTVHEAHLATKNALVGAEDREVMDAQTTFEEYEKVRYTAAYHLDADDKAPVWVSELGTASRSHNDWWSFTLRSLKDSDAAWFYSPLGVMTSHADGLFDAEGNSLNAVVGWKLQDLLEIQRPSTVHPTTLPAPGKCSFDGKANREAAGLPTSLTEFVATNRSSPQVLVAVAMAAVLPVLILFLCCRCLRGRVSSTQRGKQPPWMTMTSPTGLREMEVSRPQGPSNLWCCSRPKSSYPAGLQPNYMALPETQWR